MDQRSNEMPDHLCAVDAKVPGLGPFRILPVLMTSTQPSDPWGFLIESFEKPDENFNVHEDSTQKKPSSLTSDAQCSKISKSLP
jgi:hypothetical protein